MYAGEQSGHEKTRLRIEAWLRMVEPRVTELIQQDVPFFTMLKILDQEGRYTPRETLRRLVGRIKRRLGKI